MKAILVLASLMALAALVAGLTLLYRVADFRPMQGGEGLFPTVVLFYAISATLTALLPVLIRREVKSGF